MLPPVRQQRVCRNDDKKATEHVQKEAVSAPRADAEGAWVGAGAGRRRGVI